MPMPRYQPMHKRAPGGEQRGMGIRELAHHFKGLRGSGESPTSTPRASPQAS